MYFYSYHGATAVYNSTNSSSNSSLYFISTVSILLFGIFTIYKYINCSFVIIVIVIIMDDKVVLVCIVDLFYLRIFVKINNEENHIIFRTSIILSYDPIQ